MTSDDSLSGAENERLLELLYLCPAAIIKFDAFGAIDMINPLGAQLLMPIAPGGDLLNLFVTFGLVAPELREMVTRFEGWSGRVCDEHRVLASTGPATSPRAFVLSITIQKIDDDSFVAVISDVTAEARREMLIRRNESRLHAVFDGVRDYGICTVDTSGNITSWNRSEERLDGYRSDEIVGTSADVLLATSGVAETSFAAYFTIARGAGLYDFEGWRIRKDGSRYWASTSVSTLRDRDETESIIGYSIVTRDVTEERRSYDELERKAVTDALTGALNRRGLFDTAVREEARARLSHVPLALIMFDVDHFKAVNDRYGHPAGDIALKQIVIRAREEIRAVDTIGRYGGEEFVIILPGTDLTAAALVAERIRAKIAGSPIAFLDGALAVTVSLGVAQAQPGTHDIAALVRTADEAMYAAKDKGRNRLHVAGTASSA